MSRRLDAPPDGSALASRSSRPGEVSDPSSRFFHGHLFSLCWLIVALCGFYIIELLVHGLIAAAYPYDLNYGEGYVLNDSLRLVRGEAVWTDLTEFPMVRAPYPPLYLVLVGTLAASGPSFLFPRLVSLVSALGIGLLVIGQARREEMPWQASVGAGGLWFGSTFVYQWGPLARVDLLGLAFALGAIVLVRERPSHARLVAAAALCALSLLAKQTLVAAPLAIALYLGVRRDSRAFPFLAGVAALVAVPTVALNLASDGHYVGHVLLGNAMNPFDPARALQMAGLFVGLNVVALPVAVWAVWREWRHGSFTLVAVYIPLALATVLTVGNASSDVNYFLEPTAALALGVPVAWRQGLRARPMLAAVLALAQLVLLFHVPNGFMSTYPAGPAKGATPVAEDVRAGDRVLALIREAGPLALVEPAGFAVLAGTPVWVQPLDLQAEERLGRWNPDLLARSFADHRWSLVVLNYKFLPPAIMATLEREYVLVESFASPNGFSYFVYRPKEL